jgi:hypothetical protein
MRKVAVTCSAFLPGAVSVSLGFGSDRLPVWSRSRRRRCQARWWKLQPDHECRARRLRRRPVVQFRVPPS